MERLRQLWKLLGDLWRRNEDQDPYLQRERTLCRLYKQHHQLRRGRHALRLDRLWLMVQLVDLMRKRDEDEDAVLQHR